MLSKMRIPALAVITLALASLPSHAVANDDVGPGAEVMVRFIREAKAQGAELACDWDKLSRLLKVDIASPKGLQHWKKDHQFSHDGELAPQAGSPVARGTVRRFRSQIVSECSVILYLKPDQWCATPSARFDVQLGMGPWMPYIPLHGPDGNSTWFNSFDAPGQDRKGQLWFRSPSDGRCASVVSVFAPAAWVTPEVERAAVVQDGG